ncbi:hypothetical protein [Nostoc sp.]|uniref:hypothetical protein n=1 Tax=Nostoc sp. TaxID=1180 RepID=UPI002FFABAB2
MSSKVDLELQNSILKGQAPICRDEGSLDPVADIEEIPTFNCLKIHISILT